MVHTAKRLLIVHIENKASTVSSARNMDTLFNSVTVRIKKKSNVRIAIKMVRRLKDIISRICTRKNVHTIIKKVTKKSTGGINKNGEEKVH